MGKKTKTKNTEEIKKNKYPYAKAIFDEVKSEYANEIERENTINNKAGAFISIVLAMITISISIVPFEKIVEYWSCADKCGKMMLCVLLSIFLSALSFMFVSIGYYFRAFGIEMYNRVNFEDLCAFAEDNDDEYEDHLNIIYFELVKHYQKILVGSMNKEGNMHINSSRAKNVKIGMRFTIVGFIILSLSSIVLRMIIV